MDESVKGTYSYQILIWFLVELESIKYKYDTYTFSLKKKEKSVGMSWIEDAGMERFFLPFVTFFISKGRQNIP